jgi:hypothetical protein
LLEDDPGLLEHQLSGAGQLDAAGLAPEQRGADLLLQLSNLQGERRLVDAQRLAALAWIPTERN